MAVTTQKLLGQATGTTTAAEIYSPAASVDAVGLVMIICNYTANKRKYRIFHDATGSTYDTTNCLYYDVEIPGFSTHLRSCGIVDDDTGGIGVYADAASALVFSLYGTEIDSS